MKTRNGIASVLLSIALTMLLAGCEAPTGTPQAELKPDTGSGIQGTITLGPICPVQRWPSDCPDLPLQATLSIRDEDGNEMARLESGLDGVYSMALDPGSYVLVAQPVTDDSTDPQADFVRWPAPPAEVAVTVSADLWATVNLSYDTGIR